MKKLITGPGVYICDECTELCREIIDEELGRDKVDSAENQQTVKQEPRYSEAKLEETIPENLENFIKVLENDPPPIG